VNRKARLISIVVTLAVLGSLLALLPVFAATGTVTLDKSFITTPGGVLTVTLTDADLDAGVIQTAEDKDYSGVTYAIPAGAVGTTFYDRLQKFPLHDHNGDSVVNFQDVVVSATTTISVLSVDQNGGLVTFLKLTTGTGDFTVTYTAADVQEDVTVAVSSTQDAIGFALRLRETGPSTGVFTGSFETVLSISSDAVTSSFSEADLGVDLDGDGTATTTAHVALSATSTVSEVVARIDRDGDGVTSGAADQLGVDLNNDGDATDCPDIYKYSRPARLDDPAQDGGGGRFYNKRQLQRRLTGWDPRG